MTDKPQNPLYQFDPKTAYFLQQMSQTMGTTPENVLAEALQLLKVVQGKQVILKDKDNKSTNLEIKKYADNPSLV